MVDYGLGFRVSRNFCQAYLQEVGLTQILGDRDFFNIFFSRINFKTNFRAISVTHFRIDSRTDKHHQVVLSNWYSLRHMTLNQILPSFFGNRVCNGLQHGPLSLHTMCEGL